MRRGGPLLRAVQRPFRARRSGSTPVHTRPGHSAPGRSTFQTKRGPRGPSTPAHMTCRPMGVWFPRRSTDLRTGAPGRHHRCGRSIGARLLGHLPVWYRAHQRKRAARGGPSSCKSTVDRIDYVRHEPGRNLARELGARLTLPACDLLAGVARNSGHRRSSNATSAYGVSVNRLRVDGRIADVGHRDRNHANGVRVRCSFT